VSDPGRQDPVARDEVEALVAARRELPEGHDQELIDAFMERVSAEIDARVDQRLAEQEDDDYDPMPGQIGVAIGSIALGIPVTAVAGSTAEPGRGGGLDRHRSGQRAVRAIPALEMIDSTSCVALELVRDPPDATIGLEQASSSLPCGRSRRLERLVLRPETTDPMESTIGGPWQDSSRRAGKVSGNERS